MESKAPPPRIARIVLMAFAATLLLKVFLVDLMIAEGRSMLPTIRPGAVVLVNRAAYGLRMPILNGYLVNWGPPKTGDIVIFSAPDGVLAVKRFQESVGNNRFLAVGDNSEESYDSRQYGSIAVDSILGKVIGIK